MVQGSNNILEDDDGEQPEGEDSLDLGLTELAEAGEEISELVEDQPSEIDVLAYIRGLAEERLQLNDDKVEVEDDVHVHEHEDEGEEREEELEYVDEAIHEYEDLARKERWSDLVARCEADMAEDESNWSARLWWVKANFDGELLPATMLTAPLDVAAKGVEEGERDESRCSLQHSYLSKKVEHLSARLGADLKKKDENVLAIGCVERAYRYNPIYKGELLELVRIQIDIDREEHRRRPHLGKVEDRLEALQQLERELFESEAETVCPLSLDNLNTRYANEQKRHARIGQAQPRRSRLFTVVTASMLALLVFAGLRGYDWYTEPNRTAAALDNGSLYLVKSSTEEGEPPVLLAPEISPIADLGSVSLSGILHALDNPVAPLPAPEVNIAQAAQSAGGDSSSGRVLNISAPIEPASLADLINKIEDPVLQDQDEVEAHRSLLERPIVRGETRENPIVKAYPIVRRTGVRVQTNIAGPGLYRITRETSVYERPTEGSSTLAQLYVGSEIEVIETMGRWVRVVSRRGRDGYVLSDAAEKM